MAKALSALALLTAVGTYVGIIGVYVTRPWRRRATPPSALPGLLVGPARLPGGGYPDSWTPRSSDLADLGELQRRLWPGQGWLGMLVCRHPQLDGHATKAAAMAALDFDPSRQSRIGLCRCGSYHVRYRRRTGLKGRR